MNISHVEVIYKSLPKKIHIQLDKILRVRLFAYEKASGVRIYELVYRFTEASGWNSSDLSMIVIKCTVSVICHVRVRGVIVHSMAIHDDTASAEEARQ